MRASVLLLLAAGCTFERGGWFATLAPTLDAAWARPADREAGGGWQRLASDYQVRVQVATLALGPVVLEEVSTGGFDPDDPPAGVGPCHGGHCHTADGRLVPYEELAGDAAPRPVVALPVGAALDLASGERRALACEPRCELGYAQVRRTRAPVRGFAVTGLVRDGANAGRLAGEVPFRAELGEGAVTLGGALDLPADGRHPPAVALALAVTPGPGLLDGIDFAGLLRDGGVDLGADPVARARLIEGLAATPIGARVRRSE